MRFTFCISFTLILTYIIISFQDTNECELNPFICLHDGICVNTEGGYRCDCAQGWGGKHCEEGIIFLLICLLLFIVIK